MTVLDATPPLTPPWYEVVGAFTPMHAAAVTAFGSMIVWSSVLGLRWRGTRREAILRITWAGLMLAFLVGVSAYYMFSGDYDPAFAYPLQVCDLLGFVACLALLFPVRWFKTLTIFLGLGLGSQAFITPVLKNGPVYLHFWYFWLGHTAIVGGGLYLIVVERYRPRASDWGLSLLTLAAYIGVVLPLDIAMGWNYGFVGNVPRKPDAEPTVIDLLGEWPQRVYMLGLLAAVATGLIYLAFVVVSIWTRRRHPTAR